MSSSWIILVISLSTFLGIFTFYKNISFNLVQEMTKVLNTFNQKKNIVSEEDSNNFLKLIEYDRRIRNNKSFMTYLLLGQLFTAITSSLPNFAELNFLSKHIPEFNIFAVSVIILSILIFMLLFAVRHEYETLFKGLK